MDPTDERVVAQVLEIAHSWDGAPARPSERVALTLAAAEDAIVIRVDAPFHGDPIPTGPPGPRDGLWEYEVVELFLVGAAGRYTEVELGPHGHHLVLRLDGVRRVVARGLPLQFRATIDGGRWRGEAVLPRTLLPPGDALKLNAYAIHGVGAARRFLALTPVPGAAPDFHVVDAFEVSLDV